MPFEVNDQNFEEKVLGADGLVLVDFWADWCSPCKMIEPIVEKLEEKFESLKVAELDVDNNQKTAAKYGINGIPCLILFQGGEAVEKLVGVRPYETFEEAINKHLDE